MFTNKDHVLCIREIKVRTNVPHACNISFFVLKCNFLTELLFSLHGTPKVTRNTALWEESKSLFGTPSHSLHPLCVAIPIIVDLSTEVIRLRLDK
jgi:hypothetical protein